VRRGQGSVIQLLFNFHVDNLAKLISSWGREEGGGATTRSVRDVFVP